MRSGVLRGLYDDLATLTASGVPLVEGLESLVRGRDTGAAAVATELAAGLRAGKSLEQALEDLDGRVPRRHAAVLIAGDRAGKLPEALRKLVDEIARAQELRGELLKRLAYPMALYVLGAALPPLYLLLQGHVLQYALIQAGAFGPFVLAGGLAIWLWRRRAAMPEGLERVLAAAPIVGPAVVGIATGSALRLLGVLLEAGLGFRDALPLVARATTSGRLAAALDRVDAVIRGGGRAADGLDALPGVTASVAQRLRSGELAGALDRALQAGGAELEGHGWRRLEILARLLPIVVYLVVGCMILDSAMGVLGGGLG